MLTIDQLKERVPLPDAARRLGIAGFPDGPGKMCSPIRQGDDNPSFSIWQGDKGLVWTDHGTKESGDQITLIEKVRGVSAKEAIRMRSTHSFWPVRRRVCLWPNSKRSCADI